MGRLRRRLMMMQTRPRKAVAVRTAGGETIPVLTLYDYELSGQVQDELYEEDGKMWLRKNIVEMTLGTFQGEQLNWYFSVSLNRFLSSDIDLNNVSWQDKNAYFHIVPENGLTYRSNWSVAPMPGRHIGIVVPDANGRNFFRVSNDGFYTSEEVAKILSGAKVRVAPNIEEQIKTYEVEEVIYG